MSNGHHAGSRPAGLDRALGCHSPRAGGPILAAGIDPTAPLEAWAATTEGREWYRPAQPLVWRSAPKPLSERQTAEGLARLQMASEVPPALGDRVVLLYQEQPYLPDPG